MKIKIVTTAQAGLRTWRSDTALLVMPFTDATQAARAAGLMAMRASAPGLLLAVHDEEDEGFVSLVNRLFERSASPLFGYVGQEAFAGRGWLHNALQLLGTRRAGLLAFNDGRNFGSLAGFGLARRSWAQSVYGGSFFFPAYKGRCASAELSMIAAGQRTLVYAPESVLLQVDGDKDSADDMADRRLLLERQAHGFEGRTAVKPLVGVEVRARRGATSPLHGQASGAL